MQTLVFKLAAATSVNIMDTIVGYVRYYERTAGGGIDPRIKISSMGGGASAELVPGEAYRLAMPVRGLVVTNMSGEAIEGKLAVAPDASSIDVGRLSGVVEVVDGEKSRTLAGGMFVGAATITSSPGQYARCQIWNPVGSGKNLIVSQMSMGVAGAQIVYLSMQATALLTNQTPTAAGNKLLGGALGVGECRVESVAAPLGSSFNQIYVPSGQSYMWGIRGALVVPPGVGLLAVSAALNTTLTAGFEWFEENQS